MLNGSLLLTVLEKRVGLQLGGEDVFVNVPGGILVDEPAADLAIATAVVSSMRNQPVPPDVVLYGELGLAGEVRASTHAELRVREAQQMGFKRCLMPSGNITPGVTAAGCDLQGVDTIEAALDELFG